MRWLPFGVLSAVLLFVLLTSMMFGNRAIILGERPVISHLGEIRQPTDFDLPAILDGYGLHVVQPVSLVEAQLWQVGRLFGLYRPWREGEATPPAAGRSIKEFGFFGMPFGWKTDMGNVVYSRTDSTVVYFQLNERGTEFLTKANGGDIYADKWFRFWQHTWGWLWVLGLAIAIRIWLGIQAQRREEQGYI